MDGFGKVECYDFTGGKVLSPRARCIFSDGVLHTHIVHTHKLKFMAGYKLCSSFSQKALVPPGTVIVYKIYLIRFPNITVSLSGRV